MSLENFHVAVIGAGPAGLYGAQQIAKTGARVVMFNRDIKPGGLAEYGIYPDKDKMKDGLRAQFEKILALPNVEYLGNVTIGKQSALAPQDFFALGFDAVLVTVGAQGTKWLGLPGEHLRGVYHAKDLVYHYNKLPPFSTEYFDIGKNAVIIGVGNVMMDLAHWLIRDLKIDSVTAVARRGPAEIKFAKAEVETIGANIDVAALDAEIERCAPFMRAVGENPEHAREHILAGVPRALPPVSGTRLLFQFLASPQEICGDEQQRVVSLQVEDDKLELANGEIKARGVGTFREIPCDTLIYAIGDAVDAQLGLPIAHGEFARNPAPRSPIQGISYEAYDPQTQTPLDGIFLAGWARQASTGLVGIARKDGTQGALALSEYLKTLPKAREFDENALRAKLQAQGDQVVTQADLHQLARAEQAEAQVRGMSEFKFQTNQEMLDAMHK